MSQTQTIKSRDYSSTSIQELKRIRKDVAALIKTMTDYRKSYRQSYKAPLKSGSPAQKYGRSITTSIQKACTDRDSLDCVIWCLTNEIKLGGGIIVDSHRLGRVYAIVDSVLVVSGLVTLQLTVNYRGTKHEITAHKFISENLNTSKIP